VTPESPLCSLPRPSASSLRDSSPTTSPPNSEPSISNPLVRWDSLLFLWRASSSEGCLIAGRSFPDSIVEQSTRTHPRSSPNPNSPRSQRKHGVLFSRLLKSPSWLELQRVGTFPPRGHGN